ncbi:MAG: sigma 54-interacting transcriptional regulator, partial [Nannocystaceae bacterium]
HERSPRASAPFVVLDCTSLPATLAESLLFGHRRGAFTGAVGDARGYFEDASGGTLFIDEIAKLPLDLQGKLLRAVESREIARVGETRRRPVDVRIIAATNRDLAQMMADGEFLEDLYYRLGGIEIELPPLRERGRANLEFLASVLLERVAQTSQRTLALAPEVYDAMVEYPWPGNVRELARAMQRAVFWAEGELVRRADLRLPTGGAPGSSIIEDLLAQPYKEAMAQFEALLMKRVWSEVDGNISEAARRTGVDRRTLTKLVDGLGLRGAKDCT